MGFMSGLLGLATAFTNFSAIWILDIQTVLFSKLQKSKKSTGLNKAGGAALPLVEVLISHVCAVQY